MWNTVLASAARVTGKLKPIMPIGIKRPVTPTALAASNGAGDAQPDTVIVQGTADVDAPLGDFQKDVRPDGTTTSYHGGPGGLGVFNAMAAPWACT